jgi:hypothetical protein
MNRLGMCLDDSRAHDRQRSLRGAAQLQLEKALASLLELGERALGFSALASGSRLFGHLAGASE